MNSNAQTLKGMAWLDLYLFCASPFWVSFLIDGNLSDLVTSLSFAVFGSLHASQVMCKTEDEEYGD